MSTQSDPNAIDLGYIPPHMMDEPKPMKGKPKPPEPMYPSLHIEGDPAKSVLESVDVGQTVTATVTMRVIGKRQRDAKKGGMSPFEGDTSVEFEVQSIEIEDAADEASDANEPGENAGDAMDKFRAEKAMPAEA